MTQTTPNRQIIRGNTEAPSIDSSDIPSGSRSQVLSGNLKVVKEKLGTQVARKRRKDLLEEDIDLTDLSGEE